VVEIIQLSDLENGTELNADVVIVGGGPAGLTIAKELFNTRARVLILESGLIDETPEHAALCELEGVGDLRSEPQRRKRAEFHGESLASWTDASQPYGVRCRLLGGATHAWAGKSAPFDPADFAARPWVAHSGWPVAYEAVQPYVRRAEAALNLSLTAPKPLVETETLNSFYWQFARSRIDKLDVMRFGPEFRTYRADNVRVLLDATVTDIRLSDDGARFDSLSIAGVCGVKARVRARTAILAAGGVENPRLLLASRDQHANGIGNGHDQVGRYLMDHPGARVGWFKGEDSAAILRRFGFQGVRYDGRMHMFMHGLAVNPKVQEREGLLNTALYFMPQRAPDDPWDAIKRMIKRKSEHPLQDLKSIVAGGKLVAAGVGMKALAHPRTPEVLRNLIVDAAIRFDPNFVVEEFQTGGLPHKVTGLAVDAITENAPNPDSRVRLASSADRFGVPKALVDWRLSAQDRQSLARVAQLGADLLPRMGLPAPVLEPWIVQGELDTAVIIDMAHTSGTTRMSHDPQTGVVDPDCQVHGVSGLYVAGSSVFPTSGHANPTLMILALAIRLADHLKATQGLAQTGSAALDAVEADAVGVGAGLAAAFEAPLAGA